MLVTVARAISVPGSDVFVGYTFFKGSKTCSDTDSPAGSRGHLDGAWAAAILPSGACYKRAYTGFPTKSQNLRWDSSAGRLHMTFYDTADCSGPAQTTTTSTGSAPRYPASMVKSTDYNYGCMISPDDQLSSYKLVWEKDSTTWSPALGQTAAQTTASGGFAQTWSLAVYASNVGTVSGTSSACDSATLIAVEEQFPRCGKCVQFGPSDYRMATCTAGKVVTMRYGVSLCHLTGTLMGTWEQNKCYATDSNGYTFSSGVSYQLMDCGAPFGGRACQEGTAVSPLSAAQVAAFLLCCACLIITPILLCICCCISIGVAICIGCAVKKKNEGGNVGVAMQQRTEPTFAPQQAQVVQAQVVAAQPVVVQAQPQYVQAQPVVVQAQPQVVPAQPIMVQAQVV